jgi:hypothetical protein
MGIETEGKPEASQELAYKLVSQGLVLASMVALPEPPGSSAQHLQEAVVLSAQLDAFAVTQSRG